MNMKLSFHNIRTAWHNLMKYKVQNTIAVLCLAVGMVCFSVTLIFCQRGWEYKRRMGGDCRHVTIQFEYAENDSTFTYNLVSPESLKQISDKHLSSIECIDLDYRWISTISNIVDLEGQAHQVPTNYKLISPEHLHFLGLRSAITGKRIPVLKPGDIVMTKGMLERTFGKDVNPIGYYTTELRAHAFMGITTTEMQVGDSVYCLNNPMDTTVAAYARILDVVDTGDWMLNDDHLLVVTDLLQEFTKYPSIYPFHPHLVDFDFILAEGKTREDLRAELQDAFPEYDVKMDQKCSLWNWKEFFLIVFLGCSVLLIGLFGFLKTQVQLFRLRQREMGLRQCMGARRGQLFSLMMWEIAIVFVFVMLLTLGLTYLLADFAVPIIQKVVSPFSVNIQRTLVTEMWICLVLFLLTTGIAALSVRRVVTTPLSEVVGKSQRTATRGRSLLIILQMVVCQVFLYMFVISALDESEHFPLRPANGDAFRHCIVAERHDWRCGGYDIWGQPDFLDTIPQLQHVQQSSHLVCMSILKPVKDDELANYEEHGQRYFVNWAMLTDERLFEMLDLAIYPSASPKELDAKDMMPIYAPVERAEQLRKALGAKTIQHPDTCVIEKGKTAVCLGYVNCKPLKTLARFNDAAKYLYICQQEYFTNTERVDDRVPENFEDVPTGFQVKHFIIMKAKQGQYREAVRELSNLYQDLGYYTLAKAPLENLYEVCFNELRMLELRMQLVTMMMAIALLCIVLTLYSSVSLDTRGRQKEVAIRKAHGASVWQILWLFGRSYVWQLIISSLISLALCVGFESLWVADIKGFDALSETLIPFAYTVLIIALLTLLTVGYKIYHVSKLNPATIIKKE